MGWIRDIVPKGDFIWATLDYYTEPYGGIIKMNIYNGDYERYTAEDGLPDDYVTAISVDHSGNIWVGTWTGSYGRISRYDGSRWIVYKDSLAAVRRIAFDTSGSLWFALDSGFGRYDGERWEYYSEVPLGYGAFKEIKDIVADPSGNVWLASPRGWIFEYDGEDWLGWDTPIRPMVLKLDRWGNIWLGGDGGIYRLQKDDTVSWIRLPSPYYTDFKVSEMAIDSLGNIWCPTKYDEGIMMYNGKVWHMFDEHNTGSPILTYISNVAVDSLGNIWVGSRWGLSKLPLAVIAEVMTSVRETSEGKIPEGYALYSSYPNPFNTVTNILFCLNVSSYVRLEVYDLTGRKVRTLLEGKMDTGVHKVFWDGRDDDGSELASGVYLVRMDAGGFNKVRKVVLVR